MSAVHLISLLGEPTLKPRNATRVNESSINCPRNEVQVMLQRHQTEGLEVTSHRDLSMTDLTSSTYSDLLLEHQNELQRVLRTTALLNSPSPPDEVHRGDAHFAGHANDVNSANATVCCIRNPSSCLITGKFVDCDVDVMF